MRGMTRMQTRGTAKVSTGEEDPVARGNWLDLEKEVTEESEVNLCFWSWLRERINSKA